MYTISFPVSKCSLPSSSIMAVPDAAIFPIIFLPVTRVKSSNNFLGKEGNSDGKVVKADSSSKPANSQCPVVVSLPGDFSFITPKLAKGLFVTSQPGSSFPKSKEAFPNPSFVRFGHFAPFTVSQICRAVLEPSSP